VGIEEKGCELSADARRRNLDEALVSFMDALGDEWFCSLYISPAGFPNVLPTTWAELTSKGILQDRDLNDETYELTPFGYVMVLRVSGRSDERQFREKLGKFCKVLKGSLKRRHDIGRIAFQELVAESGCFPKRSQLMCLMPT